MKKNIHKLFILAASLALSGAAGCSSGGSSSISSSTSSSKAGPEHHNQYFEGTHNFNASESDEYMVQDGICSYSVLIPASASNSIRTAKEEFLHLFQKATGLSLSVIEDDGVVSHSAEAKYISIGETVAFKTSGISLDKEAIGHDGVRILTKDKTVYIVGGSDSGSMYGVYDFMKIAFGYEQYAPDYMEIKTKVRNLKLLNFDVTDIPDIQLRSRSYGFFNTGAPDYDASNYGNRMRMEKDRGYHFMPIYKKFDVLSESKASTNTNTYVPYEDYYDEHPNWFSNKCRSGEYQLCYTAHGDEQEYEALVDIVARKIEFSLKRFDPVNYPEMNVATFTMEDNFRTCTCEECVRQAELYGAESGALNRFVNRVGEKVEEWMELPENAFYKRPDFRIIYFAYNAFEKPPVKYENGKYVPYVEGANLELRKNVGVYFAEINNLDYQQDFWAEDNVNGKAMFDGWCALTDFLYYWTYQTNFHYYMYFYDSFAYYTQEMYNYLASKDIAMFFGQGQDSSGYTGTTWNGLKGYLDSKLMWDSTLDYDYLVQDYFRAMYGEASKKMYDYFLLTRAHNAKLLEDNPQLQCARSNYNEVRNTKYYPLETLQGFVRQVDEAQRLIAMYREIDPERYEVLYNHIEAEAVTPLFLMLDLHANSLTLEQKRGAIDRLYEDVSRLHLEGKADKEHGSNLATLLKGFEQSI